MSHSDHRKERGKIGGTCAHIRTLIDTTRLPLELKWQKGRADPLQTRATVVTWSLQQFEKAVSTKDAKAVQHNDVSTASHEEKGQNS